MRGRVFALVLALILSVSTALAAPNPKAGASCSKTGLIKIFKGKKFTCIKSGKKLVWNKGEKTGFGSFEPGGSYSAPIPSASPISTLRPTPNPSPSLSARPIGSEEQIKALAILKAAMTPKPMGERFRYHFSPNAVASFRDVLVRDLNRSISYWYGIYDNPALFNVFYGTEKDLAWLEEAWRSAGYLNTETYAEELRGRLAQARGGDRVYSGQVPNRNDASFINFFFGSANTYDPGVTVFIAHETAHIVQQYLSKNRKSQMPCWVREGTADLIGHFLGVELAGIDYNMFKQFTVNNYQQGSSGIELRTFDANQWLDHLRSLETSASGACDFSLRFAYGTGLLLSELLVADHGFEKMVSLWRSFGTSPSFREGFKSVYGKDIEDWYRDDAIPYLIAEYKRVPR